MLEVYDDEKEGVVETIDVSARKTYLLGRNSDVCDIVLSDASCSRRHAKLESSEEGCYVIEDLGSAQGTRVDGVEVKGRLLLRDRAKLEFAASKRTYVLFFKTPLSLDDKRRRLWGGKKRKHDWSEAANSLGGGDRSRKFLALMGANKKD